MYYTCGQCFVTANPEAKFTNYFWMQYSGLRDKEKAPPMVLDMSKTKRTNRVPYGLEFVEEMLQES